MIPGVKKRTLNLYDLMMYVAIARKHIRLMLLILAFFATGGLTFYVYARPIYHARSLVRVEIIARPLDSDTVLRNTPASITIASLKSPQIIERTAARLGVVAGSSTLLTKYIRKIDIKRNSEQNLEIDTWMYSYDWAVRWTSIMVEEFLAYREEQRVTYREALMKSYTHEMSDLDKKLDTSIGEKYAFREEKDADQTLIKLNQLSGLPQELSQTRQRIAEIERIEANLDNPNLTYTERLSIMSSFRSHEGLTVGNIIQPQPTPATQAATDDSTASTSPPPSTVVVVPSIASSANQEWQDIDRKRMQLEDEIAQASRIYRPGHHKMIALKKELDALDTQMALEYKANRSSFDLEYRSLLNKKADLEAKLPEYQDASKRNAQFQQKFEFYQAGQLGWSSMYKKMVRQLSNIDFTQDKERVNLYYDGLLEAKSFPESPNRMHIMIMALSLGVAVAVAVPFGIELLDHTISDFSQAESIFQIRGLGVIPVLGNREIERAALLDADDNHEQNLLENFRVIRTNLLSMGALTKVPQIIMITSSLPKEGKTVVSSNLSLSFAQMGAKTLLIDADLRRGRIHRLFGLRKAPGLSYVLTDKVSLDEACRPTGRENLHVMTAGEHLNTGTELLSSPKFAEVLAELRTRYDRIIIDTPPVLGLSETSVMQQFMDGVLFVAWCGRTPIKTMQMAIDILQNNGANFYGFVLNRFDLSNAMNYYQYYYYSNEYYRNYHALENT